MSNLVPRDNLGLHFIYYASNWIPSLKELVLSLSEEEPMLSDVVSLIRRSGCARTLKTLHLVGLMPEEEDLVRCLSQLPELDALLLMNAEADDGAACA